MKNYKQEIEKLKQGCGKERKEDLIFIVTCDSEDLCQTCQAKLQIWKQALTSEIEFLEKKVYNCKDCIFCNQNKEEDVTRIAELKKELGELK